MSQDRPADFDVTISEADMFTVPVLLKESDIPEASIAERKPAELKMSIICFGFNGN